MERHYRTILWGGLPIKRSAIPEQLEDLSTWPTVDTTALTKEQKSRFEASAEAIRLFVEERKVTIAEISRRTGVHPEQLYRSLDRCLSIDSDGRIYGFRGIVPRKALKKYTRTVPVSPCKIQSKGGAAGAFMALLEKHQDIDRWLRRKAILRNKPLREDEVRKVKEQITGIHKEFLEKLRKAGVTDSEYPFNRDLRGMRSFASYMKRIGNESRNRKEEDVGDHILPGADHDNIDRIASHLPRFILPFDGVQFDGHKIDLRTTFRMADTLGMETLVEITRIWILVALDVVTRAVLGYQVVLEPEYDSDEIAAALQSCFGSSRRPEFTIPGLSVRAGGGFPCDIFEEARYPGWRWFQYDSARANIASSTQDRLTNIVGCFIHTGRLGEPDDRAFVERFFGQLARYGFHQVPGTTGSSPTDPVKKLADVGNDLSRLMTIDELTQVIYVMLADYNGESHAGLNGRTPIEAMRYWLTKPGVQIRQLPAHKRTRLIFIQDARIVKIVGGSKQAQIPHINFEGVRYSADVLRSKPHLIGKKIRIYFNVKDIRQVRAFFIDGSELGVLIASKPWRRTPHSLRLRKEILRLVRLGKLRYRDGDDAIEAWAKYKRRHAPKDKRAATAIVHHEYDASTFSEDLRVPLSCPEVSSAKPASQSTLSDGASSGENNKEPAKPRAMKVRKVVVFRK